MNNKILLIVFIITGIIACGPSKSEKLIQEAELRAHDDSIRKATEEETKRKLEIKAAITDSINSIKIEISSLTEAIGDIKAELEVQKDNLSQIKEFQFLRTKGERESQIRAKVKEIDNLENMNLALANELVNRQVRLDYFKSELQNYSDN